jgi:hypothetical protein
VSRPSFAQALLIVSCINDANSRFGPHKRLIDLGTNKAPERLFPFVKKKLEELVLKASDGFAEPCP